MNDEPRRCRCLACEHEVHCKGHKCREGCKR